MKMNIIRMRQEERMNKINKIRNTFKLAKERGIEIDEKKLIAECCLEWSMSERIVKEYLKLAKLGETL